MSNYSALRHILDHCTAIQSFLTDYACDTVDKFMQTRVVHDAVVMNLLAIGELTTHVTEDFKMASKDRVDWRGLKQLRNIIAHRYGTIQFNVIWNIINDVLPDIEQFCLEQYQQNGDDRNGNDFHEA